MNKLYLLALAICVVIVILLLNNKKEQFSSWPPTEKLFPTVGDGNFRTVYTQIGIIDGDKCNTASPCCK